MLQTHHLGSFWKRGSDPVGLRCSFQSAFLRRRLRMYTVEDHTWSLEALEYLENTCVSDLQYQRCPNYWFKHKRWPLSRNQYAFSFKFRLREFVWQPGKAEGCCVWRNEARYLQTKTGVNVHWCVPMAFWGCLKSKEQEAREENAVTFLCKGNIGTPCISVLLWPLFITLCFGQQAASLWCCDLELVEEGIDCR